MKRKIPCDLFELTQPPLASHSLYGARAGTVGHLSLDLNRHELELVHHYQAWVSSTLSGQPPVQQTWQSAIPREAASHAGLLHSLLAVAALHRSRLDRNGLVWYRDAAIKHQNLSLAYLRSLITKPSAQNCNALFVLSTFVFLFEFALPQSPIGPPQFDAFETMIKVIELLKGVRAVTEMTRPWLLQGPLRALLLPGVWEVKLVIPDDISNVLDWLLLKNETLIQSGFRRTTYETAIRMLGTTFEVLTLDPDGHGVGLLWAAIIERRYLDLLEAREPMALVLLAHSAVGIHASRANWWSGGWGRQVVRAVYDMLDHQWRCLLHWPLINVGLYTDTLPLDCCVMSSIFGQRQVRSQRAA